MVVLKYKSEDRPPVFTFMYECDYILAEFLLSKQSPMRSVPLFFNHHAIKEIDPTVNYIFYNTEQITRDCEKRDVLAMIRSHPNVIEVWDYSVVNYELLKGEGVNVKYVPFTLTPYLRSFFAPLLYTPKQYDIGFCAFESPRRKYILDALKAKGFSVHYLQRVYMFDRDKELSKCRLLINIHYGDDFQVFEKTRCEAWLRVGYPLISETSLDPDPRCLANVPYDKLVETISAYLTG
jgi:hypothetical protein